MRLLLLLVLLVLPASAQQETFEQANEAYLKGSYARAAQLYRDLEVRDADLFYNLGNAYYQLQDWGRARAAYERARLLDPRSPDLANNLALLGTHLEDPEPSEGALRKLAYLFTLNELAVLSSLFWFAAAGLAIAGHRRRHELLLWGAAGCVCGLLFFGSLLGLRLSDHRGHAVIVPAKVILKNGPGREFTDSIPLHAGTRVRVLATDGDWLEVAALERVKGWLRTEEVERIQP